jgi:hypothetical protein
MARFGHHWSHRASAVRFLDENPGRPNCDDCLRKGLSLYPRKSYREGRDDAERRARIRPRSDTVLRLRYRAPHDAEHREIKGPGSRLLFQQRILTGFAHLLCYEQYQLMESQPG